MTAHPRDAFRGALTVAGRDLRANGRGSKVWIISGLTLLVVVGASFGIAGLVPQGPTIADEYVLWPAATYAANGSVTGMAVRVSDYLGAPQTGQVVTLGNPRTSTYDTGFVPRANRTTNATGWVAFPGLWTTDWPLRLQVGAYTTYADLYLAPAPPAANFSAVVQRFDILRDGASREVSLLAVRSDGQPAAGAAVRVNGTVWGSTGADGFLHLGALGDGLWLVNVTFGGKTLTFPEIVQTSSLVVLPLLKGPDALLLFLGVALMGLFAPVAAIAMSYDAIAKERMQGSLELLLARPASRTGIAVGKFLGSFLSVGLPMLGVLLGALVGIAGSSGQWPDPTFATAFVLGTLGLIATYVLIMQVISTLARSPGTAILSGFVLWLLFAFFWSLIFLGVSTALHVEGGTPAAAALNAVTLLFSPNGVYELAVNAFVPQSVLGLFGTGAGPSWPDWTGPLAMLVWIAALLGLAVVVFRKRAV